MLNVYPLRFHCPSCRRAFIVTILMSIKFILLYGSRIARVFSNDWPRRRRWRISGSQLRRLKLQSWRRRWSYSRCLAWCLAWFLIFPPQLPINSLVVSSLVSQSHKKSAGCIIAFYYFFDLGLVVSPKHSYVPDHGFLSHIMQMLTMRPLACFAKFCEGIFFTSQLDPFFPPTKTLWNQFNIPWFFHITALPQGFQVSGCPPRPGVPCCVPLFSPANLRRILFATFIFFECLFSATSRRGEGIEGPAAWGQDGRGHPAEGEGRLAHGALRYRSFPRCRRGWRSMNS